MDPPGQFNGPGDPAGDAAGLSAFSGNAADPHAVSMSVGSVAPQGVAPIDNDMQFDFDAFVDPSFSVDTPQGNEFVTASNDFSGTGSFAGSNNVSDGTFAGANGFSGNSFSGDLDSLPVIEGFNAPYTGPEFDDYTEACNNLFGTLNVSSGGFVSNGQVNSFASGPAASTEQPAADNAVSASADSPGAISITSSLQEIGNRKDASAHDLVTASILAAAPAMIGTDRKAFCGQCAHPGHMDMTAIVCPAGRIVAYLKHEPTLYQALDANMAALLFNSDVAMLQDGYAFSWKVMNHKQCELEVFGITAGTVSFLKKMLELVRQLTDEELLRFAQELPADANLNLGTFEFNDLHPTIRNSATALQSHRDRLVEPTQSVKITLSDVLAVLAKSQSAQAEASRRYVDPMYKVRQDFVATQSKSKASSKPGPKAGAKKKKIGVQAQMRYKLAHDPFSYIKAKVFGLRGNVRCTNCYHLGHAPNASKICPLEILNRAVINSINRTKSSWTRHHWTLQELYESLKSVIRQLEEEEDGEGVPQNKIRWVLSEFEKLNPTTGRPREQRPNLDTLKRLEQEQKDRIKLAIKIMEEKTGQKADRPVGPNGEEYDSDCSDNLVFPAEFPYPNIPVLAIAQEIRCIAWYSECGMGEVEWYREQSGIKPLGNRHEAQCPNCLGWGHDTRYLECPFIKVQAALVEKSKAVLLLEREISILAYNHDWQFSLPTHLRRSQDAIRTLWPRLLADRQAYLNKTEHYHPDYKPLTWQPERKSKRKNESAAALHDPKRHLSAPGPGFHFNREVPHRPAPLVDPRLAHMQYRSTGDQSSASTMATDGLNSGYTAATPASTPMSTGALAGLSLQPAPGGGQLYLDHTRTPASLLLECMHFVLDDGEVDAPGLKLDQARLPAGLLMKIGQFLIAQPSAAF